MDLSRRDLLKFGIAATATWATGPSLLRAQAAAKKIPIGLQLYSVRTDCAKDLPAVLAAVSKMGYKGVEFAGYYGRKADELRKLLDDNGLVCCGTHIGVGALRAKSFDATVDFNKTIGNKYLIVSGMGKAELGSAEAIKKTAAEYNELAAKAKPLGMYVGYHAHGGDFRKIDGQTVWDLFFSQTNPDVAMQMDIGNCLSGGGDPIATLNKFPGRSLTVHLKEHGGPRGAPVGEGTVPWKEVFRICESTGGTQWYIVEQESYAGTPLESVKACIDNLKKMGKC